MHVSHFRRLAVIAAALGLAAMAPAAPRAQTPVAEVLGVDLDTLCTVDARTAARVIAFWDDAPETLIRAGVDAAEQRECILTLLPEALADIVFTRSPEFGKAAEVSVLLKGLGAPDITADLRAMPLFASVEQALDTGDFSRDAVLNVVKRTATAEAAIRAKEEGRTRDGSKMTISFVTLRHDGVMLMLIGE